MKNDDVFRIKSYTPRELSERYCCSAKTFRKWLRRIQHLLGHREGHYYNPRQVKIIVEQLGEP